MSNQLSLYFITPEGCWKLESPSLRSMRSRDQAHSAAHPILLTHLTSQVQTQLWF